MQAVKTLILALVVLGSLGIPAEGAGTRWWAWKRAWWSSVYESATYDVAPQPAMTSASSGDWGTGTGGGVSLYAVQREWTPVTQLPASIALYTITGPAPGPGSFAGGYEHSTATSSISLSGFADTTAWQAPAFEYDAFVNLGEGPYASEALLTSGGAQPWYQSPVVRDLFGGVPNSDQRAAFTGAVLDRAEQAFVRSGITDISLTADPTASAAHTLSVVSGTEYRPNPDAIGITNMGGDGFSFIDKLSYAKSVDELQWAVAHNVAHELMHAFGVEHYDSDGAYLDSAIAPWEVLVDPKTVFGPEATADLLASDLRERSDMLGYGLGAHHVGHGPDCQCSGAMGVGPSPVPEPASLVLWGIAGVALLGVRLCRSPFVRAA